MVEPPPSEGGEATITAMSALAAVGQYLSTNSAKSTFLRNTTQVHSLTETLCETRRNIAQCRQDMHGFETRLSDICYVVQEPRGNEGEGYGAPLDNTT